MQTRAERRFSKLAAAINQKAAKVGATGRVTATDLARVFVAFGHQCAYCGIGLDWRGVSFDHVVPFSQHGQNVLENLWASCIQCQRSKFTKSSEQHIQWLTKLVQCEVCKREFKPRFADYQRGYGRTCSRVCSGTKGGLVETHPAVAQSA